MNILCTGVFQLAGVIAANTVNENVFKPCPGAVSGCKNGKEDFVIMIPTDDSETAPLKYIVLEAYTTRNNVHLVVEGVQEATILTGVKIRYKVLEDTCL